MFLLLNVIQESYNIFLQLTEIIQIIQKNCLYRLLSNFEYLSQFHNCLISARSLLNEVQKTFPDVKKRTLGRLIDFVYPYCPKFVHDGETFYKGLVPKLAVSDCTCTIVTRAFFLFFTACLHYIFYTILIMKGYNCVDSRHES